jgi:hypothetical protein
MKKLAKLASLVLSTGLLLSCSGEEERKYDRESLPARIMHDVIDSGEERGMLTAPLESGIPIIASSEVKFPVEYRGKDFSFDGRKYTAMVITKVENARAEFRDGKFHGMNPGICFYSAIKLNNGTRHHKSFEQAWMCDDVLDEDGGMSLSSIENSPAAIFPAGRQKSDVVFFNDPVLHAQLRKRYADLFLPGN